MQDTKKQIQNSLSKTNIIFRMAKVAIEVGIEITGDQTMASKLGDLAQTVSDKFLARAEDIMSLSEELNKLDKQPEDIDESVNN